MTYALTLLQRFGFIAAKQELPDAFEHRLTRIETRESRREVRAAVFLRTPA